MASWDIGKTEICHWIRKHFPKDAKILDVGACDGKWKKLLTEYENMVAVEAWEPHCKELKDLYKRVVNKDIGAYNYTKQDLIIFGDVLEHMSVKKAQQVLAYAEKKCTDLIVAVPFLLKQGAKDGNPWEIHIQDDLTAELMAERYPQLEILLNVGNNYCFYHLKGKNNE